MSARILVGYSGSGDIASVVRSLADTHGAEVVTLTVDLGQMQDLEECRDRALAAGAARAHVLDASEEFIRDFVLPVLQAGVGREGPEPIAAALEQPLVAKKLIEVARIEDATVIACGGVDPAAARLAACLAALDPMVRAIPASGWSPSAAGPASNLLVRRAAVKTHSRTPATPAIIELAFVRGVPTAINGVPMALTELVESLSIIGAQQGLGRTGTTGDASTDGAVPEAPGAMLLSAALRALETAVAPPELIRIQRDQAVTYARLVYSGEWFTDRREALDAFCQVVQRMVTGTVRVEASNGALRPIVQFPPGVTVGGRA